MVTLPPHNLSFSESPGGDPTENPLCGGMFPSQHQNKLIPAIYGVICLLGLLGNGLVLLVLCQRSSRRSVADTYMLNLALSDLLFLSSLPFWAVYYALDYSWVFGSLLCRLCGSLLSLNVYASVFFITCMSADRYRAIVFPLRSQRSRSRHRARWVSCGVWVSAGLAATPTAVFRETRYLEQLGVTACVAHYPQPAWFAGLALMKNTLGFLVPFSVIAGCHGAIGRHLLAAPGPDRTAGNLDRALRTVVAVVVAFFVCWFPFHVLTFLDALSTLEAVRGCWVKRAINAVLPFALCLGFTNSAVNPFIYCFVGNHFREQLATAYEARLPNLSQKRGSISTRFSSFSRKLSDLKDLNPLETLGQHKTP